MASTFKNAITTSIGTTPVSVYTAGVGTTATIIGISLANLTQSQVFADIQLYDSSANTTGYLIKGVTIEPASSFVAIGGDQKVVVEPNDVVKVTSSQSASVDCVMSVLEIS